MDLANPSPFLEAVDHFFAKEKMPTELSSRELKDMDASARRQALFSARTTDGHYLDEINDLVGSILNPKQETREGQDKTVTVGANPATARTALKKFLIDSGYVAPEGKEGTLEDLSSDARINLVVKTNADLAWGAGAFVKQNESQDEIDVSPALELYRIEDKKVPRDWETRWKLAAQECGDMDALRVLGETGRMVALKSSDIWQALGDGAGGYDDTLGNPYPPFAFNSGMWTDNVSRKEAIELGLLDEGEQAKPATFDFASLFKLAEAA